MTALPDHTVRIGSPADLVAVVPYLLGFHPTLSVVATAVDAGAGTLLGVLRFDLPEHSADTPQIAEQMRGILTRNAARQVMLVGYGPGACVTPVIDAVTTTLNAAGIQILDALRVDGGRFWSYTCADPECCPPDGRPYRTDDSAVVAGAVLAGLVARPDRNAFAAGIAPVGGPERERMGAATRAVCARTRALLGTASGHHWYRDALDRAADALDRVQAGEEIDAEAVAWLGVLLTSIAVRDAVMTFFGRYPDDVHIRLWTEVARRVEPDFAAAPATLLAFAALRTGDGSLARVAVDRALSIDPGYRLAGLVKTALNYGLPPSKVAQVDCASMADEIAAQVDRNPACARPILPEGR